MKFEQVLDEGLKETATSLLFVLGISLTSLGISAQNKTISLAKDFLSEHPTYVQQLNDLKSMDRSNKVERNKIVNQWKAFVSSQDLDPRLSRGLKITGEGELSSYKSGDMR